MNKSNLTLEVCANSFTSAQAAEKGGAVRVELCENMAEGGTTPSFGQIKLCVERLNIEVWPIIRPRGGDFLYTAAEFDVMKEDVKLCKSIGCNGVVTGILTESGEIDVPRCAELIDIAHPMPVAFHRAFDMCNNPEKALEILIELGFTRVLTSGAAKSALLGADQIAKLVKLANGRIELMPGAGIRPSNIHEISRITSAQTFHASARAKVDSKMLYQNIAAKMGSNDDEYTYYETSIATVKELIENLNSK